MKLRIVTSPTGATGILQFWDENAGAWAAVPVVNIVSLPYEEADAAMSQAREQLAVLNLLAPGRVGFTN